MARDARRVSLVAVLATVALSAAAGAAQAAGGTSKAVDGPRALAVSVPPDPVPIKAGSSGKTLVRIVNPNATAVVVKVASRELMLEDNGKVVVGAGPDPRWGKLAGFPSHELKVPAQGYLDLPLTIQVPPRLPPDLYFVGFLVTPVAQHSGALTVINQIGSFVTVDVPGPRVRKLTGLLHLPGFVLGSQASGTLQVANVGHAAVRFWGENDTTSSPGGMFRQQRLDPSLLPRGRSRVIDVSGKPAWPIGIVTITTHLTYPGRTEAMTKELIFHKRVLVVSPWVVVALGALLLAAILWWGRRRYRSRAVARA